MRRLQACNVMFAISIGFVKMEKKKEDVSAARIGSSPSHIPLELFDNDAAPAKDLCYRARE